MLKVISRNADFVVDPSTNIVICAEEFIRLLSMKNIVVPQPGRIQQLPSIDKFIIFVYIFDLTIRCSDASLDDFNGVKFDNNIMTFPKESMMRVERNVGWSFFSLVEDVEDDLDKYFDNSTLKVDYVYPKPLQNDCVK